MYTWASLATPASHSASSSDCLLQPLVPLDLGQRPPADCHTERLAAHFPLSAILLVVVVPIDISALLPTEPLVPCLCCLRSPLCLYNTANTELNGLAHHGVRDSKRVGNLHELGQ